MVNTAPTTFERNKPLIQKGFSLHLKALKGRYVYQKGVALID
jgi:hypothetical protein